MMGITKHAFEVEIWDNVKHRSRHETVYLHPTMEVYGDAELYGVFAKKLGVDEEDITYYTEL